MYDAAETMKVCTGCGKPYPETAFPIAKVNGRAYRRGKCATCTAAYFRDRYASNPVAREKALENGKKWKQACREHVGVAPPPSEAVRTCRTCDKEQPIDQFKVYNRKTGARIYKCRQCKADEARERWAKDPEGSRLRQIANMARHRERYSAYRQKAYAKRAFGTTPDALSAHAEKMFAAQDGKCACCGREGPIGGLVKNSGFGKRLVVDHCHATGKLRGLLCDFCNTALGKLDDDPQKVRNLLRYIEAWA